jgi:hypothetical protein
MAGTMPRTTSRDPWDILAQMTEALNQRGMMEQRGALQMENADFAAAQQVARMKLANELQDTSWGKRHDIGRGEQLADRTYNEGREQTLHERGRTELGQDRQYNEDFQIRGEQRRREEWDRVHGIQRGETKEDRLEQKSDVQLAEDRRRAEWDRQHGITRGETLYDRDVLRQDKKQDRIDADESYDRRQQSLKRNFPNYREPRPPGTGAKSSAQNRFPDVKWDKGENVLEKDEWGDYKIPDGYEDTGRITNNQLSGKEFKVIRRKDGLSVNPDKVPDDEGAGTMPDPSAGAPKSGKGNRSGALEDDASTQLAGGYGDDELAGGDSTDDFDPSSDQESYHRRAVSWLSSPEGKPYADLISRASDRYGLDPNMLASLLKQESGFNPNARSPAGAVGVAQFMPATAREYGIDPRDPSQAIPAAAKYLARSMQRYDGNIGLALASYNAGTGNVDKGVFPRETQNYVQAITGRPLSYWLRGGSGDEEGVTRVAKATGTRIPKTERIASSKDDDDPLFWVDV